MMKLDDAYANAAYIPGAEKFPPRWAASALALRRALGPRAQQSRYGSGQRQTMDIFLPDGTARGVMIFIHGGYWRAFGPGDWSHLAAGALERGWAVAMPGYTLAPEARISEMTREVAAAVEAVADRVAGPVVLTGHSAGAHLAARLACRDVGCDARDRIARVVPISPLADLRPLMCTTMNEDLRLDEDEARAESPALHPRPAIPVHVWVGEKERPAFLEQAQLLSRAWDCPLTLAKGAHHFDVIDGLEDADSPLMCSVLEGF